MKIKQCSVDGFSFFEEFLLVFVHRVEAVLQVKRFEIQCENLSDGIAFLVVKCGGHGMG